MGRIALANGTEVEWDLDRSTAELTLLGSGPGSRATWTLSFVILPPMSGCFPRMQTPLPAGEGLLLLTDGEHERGATSHHSEIHFISEDGTRLWSFPVQNARMIVHDGEAVIACKEPVGRGFDLVARRLSLSSGKTLTERRVHCNGPSVTSFVTVKASGAHAQVSCGGTWGQQQLTL